MADIAYISHNCDYIVLDRQGDGRPDEIRQGGYSSLLGSCFGIGRNAARHRAAALDFFQKARRVVTGTEESVRFINSLPDAFKDWQRYWYMLPLSGPQQGARKAAGTTGSRPASTTPPQPSARSPHRPTPASPSVAPRSLRSFLEKIPDFEAITGLWVIPRPEIPWYYGYPDTPDDTHLYFDPKTGWTYTWSEIAPRYATLQKNFIDRYAAAEGISIEEARTRFSDGLRGRGAPAWDYFDGNYHSDSHACGLEQSVDDFLWKEIRLFAQRSEGSHRDRDVLEVGIQRGGYFEGLAHFLYRLQIYVAREHPTVRRLFACFDYKKEALLRHNIMIQHDRAVYEILRRPEGDTTYVFDFGEFEIQPFLPAGATPKEITSAESVFKREFKRRVRESFEIPDGSGSLIPLSIEFRDGRPPERIPFTRIRLTSLEPFLLQGEEVLLNTLYFDFVKNRNFRPRLIREYGAEIDRDHPNYSREKALLAVHDPEVRTRINRLSLGLHVPAKPENRRRLDTGDILPSGEVHIYANPTHLKGKREGVFTEQRIRIRAGHIEEDAATLAHAYAHTAVHEVGHSLGLLFGFDGRLPRSDDPKEDLAVPQIVHHAPSRGDKARFVMHQTNDKSWQMMVARPQWHPYEVAYLRYFLGEEYRPEREEIRRLYGENLPVLEERLETFGATLAELDEPPSP